MELVPKYRKVALPKEIADQDLCTLNVLICTEFAQLRHPMINSYQILMIKTEGVMFLQSSYVWILVSTLEAPMKSGHVFASFNVWMLFLFLVPYLGFCSTATMMFHVFHRFLQIRPRVMSPAFANRELSNYRNKILEHKIYCTRACT